MENCNCKFYVVKVEPPMDGPQEKIYCGNDSETAIKKWFELNREHPMCADISAKSKEDAVELITWAAAHLVQIKELISLGCPYKMESIESEILEQFNSGCKNHHWEYDSVAPFTFG